ncbi:MAG: malectin [Deinococcota bacterium]|jgi:hypothetical protein|nr:malectin [Deinococcota bacterium]
MAQRVLILLLLLGIIVAGCAPAAVEEPQVVIEPPIAVEPAPEQPEELPLVPEPVEPETPEQPEELPPVTEPVVPEVVPDVPGPIVAAINAGGPEVVIGEVVWSADQYFTGGTTTTNEAVTDIAATDNDALYLTARIADADLGTFSYSIPVPAPGRYTVRLHFAEIYWGAPGGGSGGGDGSRVVDVSIEGGAAELAEFDIHAVAGPMTAVVETFEVEVMDGLLDIAFGATTNRPLVSAIEVMGPR